jgi:hypothetical protein
MLRRLVAHNIDTELIMDIEMQIEEAFKLFEVSIHFLICRKVADSCLNVGQESSRDRDGCQFSPCVI